MAPSSRGGVGAARAAKAHVRQLVGGDSRVNGIGLTKWQHSWAVKVNVLDDADPPELPETVDGVPVLVRGIGAITPHGG
ncbi:hypothetical protein GCM10027586_19090 [Kineococcus gypseus]|uniref:hypothetical protein n=1 Tax=Kineococcus gypseus TaxID=1637102 RepID=UPI003D7CB213